MEKLFCYVDETGQHTQGILFVVAIITAKHDRDSLEEFLKIAEVDSKKNATKWMKSSRERKINYLNQIFRNKNFKGKIFFSLTRNTRDYQLATLLSIANAIKISANQDYKATIYIDGLKHAEYRKVGTGLRRAGIQTEKIRGVTDESNEFIRLADSVAGLVREAEEKKIYAQQLLHLGTRQKIVTKL